MTKLRSYLTYLPTYLRPFLPLSCESRLSLTFTRKKDLLLCSEDPFMIILHATAEEFVVGL